MHSFTGVPGLLARLHAEAAERLQRAYAPKSQGPLQSALAALARFAEACPERILFKRPAFLGDQAAAAYNEWTLILLAWFLISEPSPTTGKPLKVKSVRSYISLLKGYLSFSYAFDLVDRSPTGTMRLKRLLASLAESEPLGGVRKKRRAFRRRHLRRAWYRSEVRRTDPNSVNKWAATNSSWHVLARGGEGCPSVPPHKWRADVHPTRADLTFHRRPNGTRYARLWLRPLKKRGSAPAPKVPQYIEEYDGGGSDTYAALARLVELDPVPQEKRASTPLFRLRKRTAGGRETTQHMTVADLRATVRRYVTLIGITCPKLFGAHSPRIGGATDLASTGKATELVLRAKGRWAGDVGAIYNRLTTRGLLAASRLMQRARGRDLEEILPDFSQPA